MGTIDIEEVQLSIQSALKTFLDSIVRLEYFDFIFNRHMRVSWSEIDRSLHEPTVRLSGGKESGHGQGSSQGKWPRPGLQSREVATGRAPVKDDITWSQESSTRRAGVAALLPEPQLRRHALHAGLRARRAPAVGPYHVSPQQHWQEAVVVGLGFILPYFERRQILGNYAHL